MNSYDDNLRESLAGSLKALSDQQAALLHGRSLAEADLYHAKGAVLAARDRLELDEKHRDVHRAVHHAARRAHDQSAALHSTLMLAKDGSDGAITNAATAARNLAASADAIMQLAASMGAAMNVASAALYDTELYHQITRANANLNRVANQARFLALKGTEVSSKCAESIVGALADQGDGVRKRLDDLLAQTQDGLDSAVAAVNADHTALNSTLADEVTARNQLLAVRARQEAMGAMLAGARRYANLDLEVEVISARQIKVRFAAFKAPAAAGDRGGPPSPNARTFLAIVPQNLAGQFTPDRALQLFSKWNGQPGTFTALEPGESIVTLKHDVYGGVISSTNAYAAFLYVEPGIEYKRYLGNFADYLSIASPPFTPLTPLPAPAYAGAGAELGSVLLTAVDEGQEGGLALAILPELEAGAAELTELAAWLQANGASLAPDLALELDAVVPPFLLLLKADIAALKEGRPGVGAPAIGDLLKLLDGWPLPAEPVAQVAALRLLLPVLGGLVEKAAAPAGHAHPGARRAELRCILVDHAVDAALADPEHKGTLPPWFTPETARQVAPANYLLARLLEEAPAGAKPAAKTLWYALNPGPKDRDCFGNPLLPGHRYALMVLSTMRGPDPGGWQDTLTILDHVWHLA